MTDKIKVFMRLRPCQVKGGYSTQGGYDQVLKYTDHRLIPLQGKEAERGKDGYLFQRVFKPEATNKHVFGEVKEVVSGALDGVSGTVLAYGQTATGKTHTMRGNEGDPGVIERVLRQMFADMGERHGWQFTTEIAYFEIHNERVYDLLSGSAKELEVRTEGVQGLVIEEAGRFDDALGMLLKGDANRRKTRTDLNEYSSRSHSVFRVHITAVNNAIGKKRKAFVHLVDLAGSESAKAAGYQSEATAREGGAINKSLLALTNVIKSLADKQQHINYRDSKLTRLLANSLGGTARTYIICCVTSELKYFAETMSTIHFANRARVVYNAVRVNETDGSLGIAFNDYLQLRNMHVEDMALAEQREKQLEAQIAHSTARALDQATKEHNALVNMFVELDYTMQKEVCRLSRMKDDCERRAAKKDEEIARLTDGVRRGKEKLKEREDAAKALEARLHDEAEAAAAMQEEELRVQAGRYEAKLQKLTEAANLNGEAAASTAAAVTNLEAQLAEEKSSLQAAQKEVKTAQAALAAASAAGKEAQAKLEGEIAAAAEKLDTLQTEAAATATRLAASEEHVAVLQAGLQERDLKLLALESGLAGTPTRPTTPRKRTSTEAFGGDSAGSPGQKRARQSVEVKEVVMPSTARYDTLKTQLRGALELAAQARPRDASPPAKKGKAAKRSHTSDGRAARSQPLKRATAIAAPPPLLRLSPEAVAEAKSTSPPVLLSSLVKADAVWPDTARHGAVQPKRAAQDAPAAKGAPRSVCASPAATVRRGVPSPSTKRMCSASPLAKRRPLQVVGSPHLKSPKARRGRV